MNKMVFGNGQNSKNLQEGDSFLFQNKTNGFLTANTLTMGHLKIYLRLKFATYKNAGLRANLSATRTRQIINGYYLPQTPELIKQIAEGWGIDAVVLANLFAKYRGRKGK